MDIIKELEAMRKRIIQEVNMEFDLLVERAMTEGLTLDSSPSIQEYESTYPLTAGTKIFKGTKPTMVIFPNRSPIAVSTWKQVVSVIMEQCLQSKQNQQRLIALSDRVSGRKRKLLAKNGDDMRSPIEVCEGLFMETHYDTETLLNVLTNRILDAIQYDYSSIQIMIRNR